MERRGYLRRTGAAVAGGLLAGCVGGANDEPADEDDTDGTRSNDDGGTATGTLSTSVTDRPVDIGDFESCVVTIDGIWVKSGSAEDPDREEDEPTESDEGGGESDGEDSDAQETREDGGLESEEEDGNDEPESEEEGDAEDDEPETDEGDDDAPADEGEGRRYIEFEGPQTADLVQLQGSNTQLINETELVVGEYQFLQLDVSDVEGTLVEGGDAEVETPGNAPLQFKQSFEIRADERTRFVADFAPIRRGQGDRYLIRPVASGTRVLYGDEEYDPEGGDDGGEPSENDGTDDAPDEESNDAGNESDDAGNGPPDDAGD